MVAGRCQELLERRAVEHVFARVDLESEVAAGLLVGIEDRAPATAEFGEARLDEAGRALRPGIDEGPGERTGEGHAGPEPEVARGPRRHDDLFDRPGLPGLRIAVEVRRREGVEGIVIGRVHGDELALKVGRELGDGETVGRDRAGDLVAIGLRFGRAREVEEARVPGRDLHALVAEPRGPAADGVEAVERRGIARELGQEQAGAFECLGHDILLRCRVAAVSFDADCPGPFVTTSISRP